MRLKGNIVDFTGQSPDRIRNYSIWSDVTKNRYQCYERLWFQAKSGTPVTFELDENKRLAINVVPIRVHMMMGVQGSGKSTFINKNLSKYTCISTDGYIDRMSRHTGLTYSELFNDYFDDARKYMHLKLKIITQKNEPFVWDQMNLTAKTRQKALSSIPKHYEKIAIFFEPPPIDILEKRIKSRIGKNIPMSHVLDSLNKLEKPTFDEGFDQIKIIKYDPYI
jgi:predicted kinase